MRVANAGSVPPIIKRHDGTIEWVDVVGLPLGISSELTTDYHEMDVPLNIGDLVILTSDGVIEAKNDANVLFGFDGLEYAIQTAPPHAQHTSQAMLEHIKHTLDLFVGNTEPHDDITIVVLMI
jgi:serine phosphatase RsbU (regulator of sigma subunit)